MLNLIKDQDSPKEIQFRDKINTEKKYEPLCIFTVVTVEVLYTMKINMYIYMPTCGYFYSISNFLEGTSIPETRVSIAICRLLFKVLITSS